MRRDTGLKPKTGIEARLESYHIALAEGALTALWTMSDLLCLSGVVAKRSLVLSAQRRPQNKTCVRVGPAWILRGAWCSIRRSCRTEPPFLYPKFTPTSRALWSLCALRWRHGIGRPGNSGAYPRPYLPDSSIHKVLWCSWAHDGSGVYYDVTRPAMQRQRCGRPAIYFQVWRIAGSGQTHLRGDDHPTADTGRAALRTTTAIWIIPSSTVREKPVERLLRSRKTRRNGEDRFLCLGRAGTILSARRMTTVFPDNKECTSTPDYCRDAAVRVDSLADGSAEQNTRSTRGRQWWRKLTQVVRMHSVVRFTIARVNRSVRWLCRTRDVRFLGQVPISNFLFIHGLSHSGPGLPIRRPDQHIDLLGASPR